MISTIIFVLSLLVSAGYAISTRQLATNQNSIGKWITTPVIIFAVGFIIMVIQPYSLSRVNMGYTGLKVNLIGSDRGVSDYVYKTGWVVYNGWTENLYEFPTFQQHIEYDSMNVITKGGFSATIKPSFNYNIIPTAVGDMFVNLRLDVKAVEQGWLKNAIGSSVNDVVNKWTVDDIFNKREQFESEIITECNKRVSKWFIVSQLRTNIVPPPALQAAINNKTQAIQNAQAEIQKAIVADAQAKVKIANAKGDSAQVVIKASGDASATIIAAKAEADAMKMKQLQLSQLYIDYIRASNWNGQYPTTMLGGNTNALLNIK